MTASSRLSMTFSSTRTQLRPAAPTGTRVSKSKDKGKGKIMKVQSKDKAAMVVRTKISAPASTPGPAPTSAPKSNKTATPPITAPTRTKRQGAPVPKAGLEPVPAAKRALDQQSAPVSKKARVNATKPTTTTAARRKSLPVRKSPRNGRKGH